MEIDRSSDLYDKIPRDDNAYMIADNYMYIHGGFSIDGVTNSLARVDLSSDVLLWELISTKQLSPSARDAFTMDRINDKLWMYGGLSGDHYSDELWEFNLES